MNAIVFGLYGLPLAVALLLMILPSAQTRITVIITSFILSGLAVYVYLHTGEKIQISLPQWLSRLAAIADILLLLYFGFIAFQRRSLLVGLLSALQLGGLLYLLLVLPESKAPSLLVDRLSSFMFLLINIISGIIAIFSLRYIEEENCSRFRRNYFLSIIFWFIAVMNLAVSSDNLEFFFLFFELTTLASFLFISFRKDKESIHNALTALWMNQVGGLAILAAIFLFYYNGWGEASFSHLIGHAGSPALLLPLALLALAALVKGAQLPFSQWLLGAMVAPTPVSALLHSSTMVKLAPFMFLRMAPVFSHTVLASIVSGLTAFVFVAAAISALAQDNIKRILAHSTIALLALMIMMAVIDTPATRMACLMLIIFHGISKCLLFLNAGVLERVFHLKQTSDMDSLAEAGPATALLMALGFMSLLLPPFGGFLGKWISIESLTAASAGEKWLGVLLMAAIATGGAVLSLLYFKVMGVMISRRGNADRPAREKMASLYAFPLYLLLGLLVITMLGLPFLVTRFFAPVAGIEGLVPPGITGWTLIIGNIQLPLLPMLIAFLLLPVTIIAAMFIRFRGVDRVAEYTCGEKVNYSFSSLYFSTDKALPWFRATGILFVAALLLAALL